MSAFGKETVGGSTINLSVGKLTVNAFPKAKAGKISKLTIHVAEGGNTGTAKMKAIVYADDGTGRPGVQLAEGTEVTYKNGEGTKWLDLPLPSEPDALGARVHIGVKLGGTPNVVQFAYDETGGEHDHTFKEWTYTTAAPTAWSEGEGGGEVHKGVGGFDTKLFSIYATYLIDPPSVTNPGTQTNTVGLPIVEVWPVGVNIESWGAIGLPVGLAIDPATGHISGTPLIAGSVTVSVIGKGEGEGAVTFTWNVQTVAETKTYGGHTAFSPFSGTLGEPTSAFNRLIGQSRILANSAAMVKWLLTELSTGLGVAHQRNQFPTVYAKDTDPQIELIRYVTSGEPGKEPNGFFHKKIIRIPAAAKCQSNSDKHLQIVLCPQDCAELGVPEGTTCDIWKCSTNPVTGKTEDPQETITYEAGTPNILRVSSCGKGNITGSLSPPPGGASVAANYDLCAGAIRGPELQAGRIEHALVAVVRDVLKNPAFVYPANHTDGSVDPVVTPQAPAMGQRFYLAMSDAAIEAAGLPHPYLVAVAKALAHYGFYIEDTGGTSTKPAFRTENDNMQTAFGAPGYMTRVASEQGLLPDSEGVLLDYSPLLGLLEANLKAVVRPAALGSATPTITKPATHASRVGVPDSLIVVGTNVTTWSASGLPPGITINPATGQLSGSATAHGAYTVTLFGAGNETEVESSFVWLAARARTLPFIPSGFRSTPGFAYTWGAPSAGHSGQGFATIANMPWSDSTIFPPGVEQIGMGLGSISALVNGEVYMAGHDVQGIVGAGHGPWNPGELNFAYKPVKVTGGVPQFEAQAMWHQARVGSRAFRPAGPITPRMGSTSLTSPQRIVEIATKGSHTHARRRDGRAMAWGESDTLAGGWNGIVFIEGGEQPSVPNKDEEGGWFMPQTAPNWVCVASNSIVGLKFGGYTGLGAVESTKFGLDLLDGTHRSIFGEVSGTIKPRFTNTRATRTKWTNAKGGLEGFYSILYTGGSNVITVLGELVPGPSSPSSKSVGTWQGAYEATKAYKKGDIVMFSGVIYLAKAASTGKSPPENLGTSWELGTYSGEATHEATGLSAICDGLHMVGSEYVPGGAYLIEKVATNAKGEASATSFLISKPAIISFSEVGQTTGSALQTTMWAMSDTVNSKEPNIISVVATGPLTIDCSGWTKEGETMLFVRQDAVGGHAITLTGASWGADGAPQVNARDHEIGPLTFNGDPVTEASELGNPVKWRYTINTGKEAITMIPLYCNGSAVYAGTIRTLGDGVNTAPIVQISTGKGACMFLLSDGSIFFAGAKEGKPFCLARRDPLSESFAGPGHSPKVVEVALGTASTARMADGTIRTWGTNTYGQLGNGSSGVETAVYTPALTNVAEVRATEEDSLARDTLGRVFAWGRNHEGAGGQGTTTMITTPTQVPAGGGANELPLPSVDPVVRILSTSELLTGEGVKQAAASAFVTKAGLLYNCGGNEWTGLTQGGTLGDLSFIHKLKPQRPAGVPQLNVRGVYGQSGDNMAIVVPEPVVLPLPALELVPFVGGWLVKWRIEGARAAGFGPRAGFLLEYRRTATLRFASEVALETPPQLSNIVESKKKSPVIPYPAKPGEIVSYKDNHGVGYTSDGTSYEYRIYLDELLSTLPPEPYTAGRGVNNIKVEVKEQLVKLASTAAEVIFLPPPTVEGGYPKEGANWLIPIQWVGPTEPLWETEWRYSTTYIVSGKSKTMALQNGPAKTGPAGGTLTATLVVAPFSTGGSPATLTPTFDSITGLPTNLVAFVKPYGRWQSREVEGEPL